jgi:hypothetical protein
MLSFFGNTAKSYLSKGDSPNAPTGTKVIVVAGQSNAGGERNSGSDLPGYLQGPLTGLYRKYKYNQVANTDAFAVVNDTTATTIGCDLNLGYLYQQFCNENVYIIKHAYGATALSQDATPNWNKNTANSLFGGLKENISTGLQSLVDAGLNPSIRGFVWYQGEEDAFQGQSKAQYKANEQSFFSQLKTELSLPDFEIYSVLIQDKGNGFGNIRQAKIENAAIIPNYNLLNVDGFAVNAIDGLHLTIPSQMELGRRIFELLKFN